MVGIKDLDELLKAMKPVLVDKDFVFCTVSEEQADELKSDALLVFKEKEGITIIIEKAVADKDSIPYSAVWAMITLTVHSDLETVGFLARITAKLAEEGISVNAVSAYYHDHLFVPLDTAERSMEILSNLS